MSVFLAFGFVVLALVGVVAYNGTPHGGPTAICSPIDAFGLSTSVPFDCRYLTFGEIAFIVLCFLLAVVSAFSARPSAQRPVR
jgi:hypothetical protein